MSKKFYVNIDMQSNKLVSVGEPSSASDAATKNYVDTALLGIGTPIGVKARSSTNVDISQLNNGDSLGGATVATGDLVFLDGQTTPTEDGAYVVGATAGTTVRSTALAAGEDARGLLVVVEAGTFAGNLFLQTANPAIVGTDGLTLTGPLAAGITYSADGNGIELSSTTFSLELDGTTLTKGASGLRIGSGAAGSGLTEASGVLAVNTGSGLEVNSDAVRIATGAAGTGLTGGGGSALSRDHSLVADWKSALGPASAGTTITYAHGLGQAPKAVLVTIEATGEDITHGVDITVDATNVTVGFGSSQADRSAYRVSAVG